MKWTQPIDRSPWTISYESLTATALITGMNLAVLQAEQQYLWLENIWFVISKTTFQVNVPTIGDYYGVGGETSDGGIGINIYDSLSNRNPMGYIYLPPGNNIAKCLAWTLVLVAATVGVLAVGALVTEIARVNPAAPFTCAFAAGLAATLGAMVLDPVTKAAKDACGIV